MEAARSLIETDQRHIIHPLHHPKDHEQPILFVEGRNEMLIDADGKQYIDGLSSLWNVNAGHGRKEFRRRERRRHAAAGRPCHGDRPAQRKDRHARPGGLSHRRTAQPLVGHESP